jgi:hypothetical protein
MWGGEIQTLPRPCQDDLLTRDAISGCMGFAEANLSPTLTDIDGVTLQQVRLVLTFEPISDLPEALKEGAARSASAAQNAPIGSL